MARLPFSPSQSLLLCLFLLSSFLSKSSAELNLRQLHTFGCDITGANLEEGITADDFDLVHEALLFCKVLIIRDQSNLSVEKQRAFSKRFGKLHVHLESASHYQGYEDVNCVSNIKNENGAYIGLYGKHVEEFHSDLSWASIPTKVTVVKSQIRPEGCGDTEFLDSTAAYEALSATEKEFYSGLTASYCYLKQRNTETSSADLNSVGSMSVTSLKEEEMEAAKKCALHPVLTTHPITGARNIFVNPSHTQTILNLHTKNTTKTSEEVLRELFEHMQSRKDSFVYRHVWMDGDLVMWDNRAVQHRATGCPDEQPRLLVRTTVLNESPPEEVLAVPVPALLTHGLNLAADRLYAEEPM